MNSSISSMDYFEQKETILLGTIFICIRLSSLKRELYKIVFISLCWSTSREREKGEEREKGKREEKKEKREREPADSPWRVMTCDVWSAGLCEAPRPPRAKEHVITLLRGGSLVLHFLSRLVLPSPHHQKTLRKDWLNGRCEKTLFFLKPHF